MNIYSPCDSQQKRILWDALKQIKQQDPDCIWCFMGDFNNIRHHSEREGISPRGAEASIINDFNEWIAELELQELPSVGEEIHMVQTKWGFKESARQVPCITQLASQMASFHHFHLGQKLF